MVLVLQWFQDFQERRQQSVDDCEQAEQASTEMREKLETAEKRMEDLLQVSWKLMGGIMIICVSKVQNILKTKCCMRLKPLDVAKGI